VYKKRGRHDIEVDSAKNKVQFASQFFNFLRKHPELVISQVSHIWKSALLRLR
jgi:hypothetical protein